MEGYFFQRLTLEGIWTLITITKLLFVPIVICNKAFLTNSELKRHQDREAGNHKFKCEVCQVGFEEKRELHDHMDSHSRDKRHSCPDCRKTFRYKNNLYRHSRLHEEAKTEHRCDVCDEKFSQVRYLREHIQLHSNDRIQGALVVIMTFAQQDLVFQLRQS